MDGVNFEPYSKNLVGYSFFAGIEFLNKKHFGISTNVGYIRTGGKIKMPITDYSFLITAYSLDYLSVNATLDLKYPIMEKWIPFISVGPRFDYFVRGNKEINSWEEIRAVNKNNPGLLLGGGLKYDLNKFIIGIQSYFYLNFNPVMEWSAQDELPEGSANNRTVTINVCLGYKL
jgi:opacity protein-like surface antigen